MSWDWGLAPDSTERFRLIRFSRFQGLSGSPAPLVLHFYQVYQVLQVSSFPDLSGFRGSKESFDQVFQDQQRALIRFIRFSRFPGIHVYQVLYVLQVYWCSPGSPSLLMFSRSKGFTMVSKMNLKLEILKDPGDGFPYLWKVWFEEWRIDDVSLSPGSVVDSALQLRR